MMVVYGIRPCGDIQHEIRNVARELQKRGLVIYSIESAEKDVADIGHLYGDVENAGIGACLSIWLTRDVEEGEGCVRPYFCFWLVVHAQD
jgi:hypothetical protein